MQQTGIIPRRTINVGPGERGLSILAGSLLLLNAISRPKKLGFPLFLGGSYLIFRGISGYCLTYDLLEINRAGKQGERGIRVTRTVTINRPRQEVYRFWRDFEHLPAFMEHLESVENLDDPEGLISHWIASGPLDTRVEWDAEIFQDQVDEFIAWRSLPGSLIENAGEVLFKDAPGNRGTEVYVNVVYNPPAGSAGAAFARLFGEEPDQQIAEDLRHFKQIMETGEIPTVTGQTSGRISQTMREREELKLHKRKDIVQIASEESFPASDPPAYTTGEKEEVSR